MIQTASPLLLVLAALAGAGTIIFLAYKRDLEQARARVKQGVRMAHTAAGRIEYADLGSGTPLLSIHGAGGGHDQGLAVVADFIGNDFRVIAPSRFGYLGTPAPPDASVAAQADAHAALLEALNIRSAIIVGASAGARSAVALAIRHPERVAVLVLLVPGTYAPTSPVAVEGSRASAFVLWLVNAGADFAWWALERLAPTVLIRFMGVPPSVFASACEAEQNRVMQIVRNVEPLSLRTAGLSIDSQPASERPSFERIKSPTLVISARDDLFNTLPAAEYAASAIPGARLEVYSTGGHLLVERAHDIGAVVRGFVAEHARPAVP